MRTRSITVVSSIAALALGWCGFLVARKYGVRVELTRNADANERLRELEANERLRHLAANPKLTVARLARTHTPFGVKKEPTVLCVLNRNVLWLLQEPKASRPLLARTETIDVEAADYDKTELPALIAEVIAVHRENASPELALDLNTLIECLEKEKGDGSKVVLY